MPARRIVITNKYSIQGLKKRALIHIHDKMIPFEGNIETTTEKEIVCYRKDETLTQHTQKYGKQREIHSQQLKKSSKGVQTHRG